MQNLLDVNELGFDRIERYVALRKAGKLGVLWVRNGGFALSDPSLPQHIETAEHISVVNLRRVIDYWHPRVLEADEELQSIGPMRRKAPGAEMLPRHLAQRYHFR